MFSWLNFEELLIHNPIELINPSKDTISVAMSKKQYIEFFSNKYTYNGLYYDEAMDFCLFYYADPLQSYKEGDVYAQGYIDVEMKIYRVKWLCNVSISRSSGLLQTNDGTQGVPQDGGKYTHTAWAYSLDGTDRFSAVYPRYNLLEGTKDFSGTWSYSKSWTDDGTYKSLTVKKRTGQFQGINKTFTAPKNGVYTFSAYIKSSGDNANIYRYVGVNAANAGTVIPNTLIGNNFDWLRDSFQITLKTGDTVWARYEISGSVSGSILWTAGHKWEPGSTATPYMQSQSEVTQSDYPTYIGTYTDYTAEDSPYPESYNWSKIQNKWNVSKTGMVISPQTKVITMVQAGALMRCGVDNNISGWTDGTTRLDLSGDDFLIDGYGMRGLHNG